MEFETPENRQDIVRSAYNFAKYVHENNVTDIILLDGSARPAYVPLLKAWKIMYKNEKRPDIYFINPKGFKAVCLHEELQLGEAYRETFHRLSENKEIYRLGQTFDKTYPKLAAKKDSNILIFDTCMHSGRTMMPVYKTLLEAGYTNVKTGLSQKGWSTYNGYEPDFEALDYESSNGCRTFGYDYAVNHFTRSNSILSETDAKNTKLAASLRKELSGIVTQKAINAIKETPKKKNEKNTDKKMRKAPPQQISNATGIKEAVYEVY